MKYLVMIGAIILFFASPSEAFLKGMFEGVVKTEVSALRNEIKGNVDSILKMQSLVDAKLDTIVMAEGFVGYNASNKQSMSATGNIVNNDGKNAKYAIACMSSIILILIMVIYKMFVLVLYKEDKSKFYMNKLRSKVSDDEWEEIIKLKKNVLN